ncbi:MAG: hypothetical protein ACYC9R_06240 [Nitrosotalea sp.]
MMDRILKLNMSRVLKKERCPRCAKLGKDTSKDNLAIYDDGHKYCYGCGYTYYGHNSIKWLKNKINPVVSVSSQFVYDLDSICYHLPLKPLRWLTSYGILPSEIKEHRMFWDINSQTLQMPIYDGDRLMLVSGRYFGDNPDYPKYIIRGQKKGFFKIIQPSIPNNIYVLVEDYISAIKVGRQYNTVPILGSYVPHELVLSLMRFNENSHPIIRIWLDPDKRSEAIRQAAYCRQLVWDTGTIISDKDPKDYNDTQIKELVSATLSNVVESTP